MNIYTHQGHSFTDPEGAGYNPVADHRSWAAQMQILEEHLGESEPWSVVGGR